MTATNFPTPPTGYQYLELLYSASRTLVYRGIRLADSRPVVIKLLRREHPTFSEILNFRNQYAIANNLNHEGIVKAIAPNSIPKEWGWYNL